MNLTKLKTFAPAARNAFIDAVARRAGALGIQAGRVEAVTESGDVALIGGQPFPRSIVPLRKQLLDLVQRDGFGPTMESMAYTWFNRLVALRFMELHDGYLDHGYRVLSHPEGSSLPEILQHAEHVSLAGLDRDEVIRLKLDGNRDEELYRMLLLAQCHELGRILPSIFSRLDDATILLLPDNLLHSDSVVRQLVGGSEEGDWQEVEVLGWLYQFYISEKKDKVMARKSAVPTEDIPAVTQLFTPHWIVRYLVENSLGRLWLLNRPGSRLRENNQMPYYIEGEPETDFLKINKPEDIKLVDPAVGSAHLLTYAFDLLVLIYEEEGYAPAEIPGLILRHNLHGLDLCPRAAQLAELALVFKAREKSRRFFQEGQFVRPNIIELRNVSFAAGELHDYIQALGLDDLFNRPVLQLLHQFEEAKNFGSLIQPCLDERAITDLRRAIEVKDLGGQLFLRETHLKVLRVLNQAEALTQRYHVVVANPPYMGDGQQNSTVKVFLREHYLDSKADLFACFIERSIGLSLSNGYAGLVTRHGWMFIASFEKLRTRLLREKQLVSLAHLGARGFDSISGEVVQVAAFVFQNKTSPDAVAQFRDLRKGRDEAEKGVLFLNPNVRHIACASQFLRIPGAPLCYWISIAAVEAFARHPRLGDLATIRAGLQTGDNNRFLRLWHEVGQSSLGFGYQSRADAKLTTAKWFPINKGGSFRKWCGNSEYVINWFNDGEELKQQKAEDLASGKITANNSKCWNQDHYFKRGLSWSAVSSEAVSVRLNGYGYLFDTTGQTAFPEGNARHETLLALLNSGVAEYFLNALSPTMHFNSGNFADLPVPISVQTDALVTERANKCVGLARADWDNFETSWDFRDQPLLRPGLKGATLEACWRNWEAQSTATIRRMQELETENNRLFIAAYGLDGALQSEVPEEQISLFCNPASRYKKKAKKKKKTAEDDDSDDSEAEVEAVSAYSPEERSKFFRADTIREFLSYAIGCMMGRYSPDHPGLILANAGDSAADFRLKLTAAGLRMNEVTFLPDEDGILPLLDGEWFEDDIVLRTREFLRATFGAASVDENVRFIEAALGSDLRGYYLSDFYKDHLQTYKNRPIYWLFSSGKQKAFQCLVYLHRYTPGTLARMRTEYVIPLQGKLAARIPRLEEEIGKATTSASRKKLQTDLDKTKKQIVELVAYDEQLRSYSDQAIALDLDDGVKVNYAKFGTLLAEAKKVCGTKDD